MKTSIQHNFCSFLLKQLNKQTKKVWEANWIGTPVAVKLFNNSAQPENVSKAILQEFAAEINLLSGMRHPNICLYIGACLEAPNRAIVTELASNGSLWDALRHPLSLPFVAYDGISRGETSAWPTSIFSYQGLKVLPPPISNPNGTNVSDLSTYPPKGTW